VGDVGVLLIMAKISITTNEGELIAQFTEKNGFDYEDDSGEEVESGLSDLDFTRQSGQLFLFDEIFVALKQARAKDLEYAIIKEINVAKEVYNGRSIKI